ncbi:hypothetical protein Salat_1167700 [Sesamum alatum]|uniref:Uncharacterized protein n=1 Tax=Sesamum alatum TaxID=300844 RepID=A0AAE1YEE9_9LAMI|nr:hypothetical protein Salat_1167700 [Sesamum alatum]
MDTSGVCTKAEFFFLWCMLHGMKVNLRFWMVAQLPFTLNKKRSLIYCSYVTLLAINIGVYGPDRHNFHDVCAPELLDMACLLRMGLVIHHCNISEFALPSPSLPWDSSSS